MKKLTSKSSNPKISSIPIDDVALLLLILSLMDFTSQEKSQEYKHFDKMSLESAAFISYLEINLVLLLT